MTNDPAPRNLPATDEDWFLQVLVTLANHGGEFGITLQVPGGHLVSGILTSGRVYGEALAQLMSGPVADAIRNMFEDAYPESSEPANETDPRPRFVHLRQARYFHASGVPIPTNEPVLWRGRISQVAGFTIGQLSSDRTE